MLSPNIVTVGVTASIYGLEGDTSQSTEPLSPRDPLNSLLSVSIPSSAVSEAERCQKNQTAECVHRQKYAKSVILHVLLDLWVNFPLQKKKLEKKLKINLFRAQENTQRQPRAWEVFVHEKGLLHCEHTYTHTHTHTHTHTLSFWDSCLGDFSSPQVPEAKFYWPEVVNLVLGQW